MGVSVASGSPLGPDWRWWPSPNDVDLVHLALVLGPDPTLVSVLALVLEPHSGLVLVLEPHSGLALVSVVVEKDYRRMSGG